MKKKKMKLPGKKANPFKVILPVAAVLVVVYVAFGLFFANHFYIRSTVNGVGTSFKSAQGAYDKILEDASGFSISIVAEDDSVIKTISSEELGLSVDYDESDVAALLEGQNGFAWPYYLIVGCDYNTAQGNTYNQAQVETLAASIDIPGNDSATESTDATINYNESSGKFEIVEETYGNKVETDQLAAAIADAAGNLKTTINLKDGDCYGKPATLSTDDDINAAVDQLNAYMERQIHYDLGEGYTEEIPDATKATWFTWDKDFNVDFNQDAIGEWVNSMGDKYNTYGKAKEFTTSSGLSITVPAGSFGWKIAYQGEIDQIMADLQGDEDVTRDFTYLYKATSHGEKDYGNSYVEVNLTAQHVYVYKDGSMVFDTDCVTGNVLAGHGTHTGCYPIAYKQKDATLKGANYESHVNYWMPFNMGEGLHDATWRSKFGGTIYQGNGSHGCVNLPKSAAAKIYDIVEAGWPVLVFYTGNTEAQIAEMVSGNQNKVIDAINAIGPVTSLDQEATIVAARAAYDALSDGQKDKVTNYQQLVDAENTLAILKAQAGVTDGTTTDGTTTDGTATDGTTTDGTTGTVTDPNAAVAAQ